MTHLASKLLLSGLGLAALAATATAAAPADTVAPAVAVRYDSMMLATDRGARTLYARLSAAADKVCQDDSVGSHLPSVAALQCRKQAIQAAVEKVHNPRLVAVSRSSFKSG
jgi:UrcA family protein